ncbi:MAG: hypothetical protein OXK80_03555 [Bdellovibrionales bacterium]|nr:hypothetical protein [Bdellovibrionales bacterium]
MLKKWLFTLLILAFLQVISWNLLFSYKREQIYSFWNPSQDRLLSTVVGDISGEGHYFKVLKFRTSKGVRMEFLRYRPNGIKELVREVNLPGPYNGFFAYRGHSVQLAMGDINGDGLMEVMAPTFDENLKARLNVYYYHTDHQNFHPFLPQ